MQYYCMTFLCIISGCPVKGRGNSTFSVFSMLWHRKTRPCKKSCFYKVSRASSGALSEKLQKQVFDFLVVFELTQVWRKPFSVKAQLFRRCGCPLRFFCSRFPPCGVDCLLIRCRRRALCLNKRHCLFVQCIAFDLAHLDERRLRSPTVICDQVSAGQIQLLCRISARLGCNP